MHTDLSWYCRRSSKGNSSPTSCIVPVACAGKATSSNSYRPVFEIQHRSLISLSRHNGSLERCCENSHAAVRSFLITAAISDSRGQVMRPSTLNNSFYDLNFMTSYGVCKQVAASHPGRCLPFLSTMYSKDLHSRRRFNMKLHTSFLQHNTAQRGRGHMCISRLMVCCHVRAASEAKAGGSTSNARSVGNRFLWLSTSTVCGVLANAGKDRAFVGCCGDDLERAAKEV